MEIPIPYYKKHNILVNYSKKKSPYKIAFVTDDPDGWFIDVIYYKKDGEVHEVHHIILKDMETWKRWLAGHGWQEV